VFESGEQQLAAGQTTATLVVPIIHDSTPENPELVQVAIDSPHGARVGPAAREPNHYC